MKAQSQHKPSHPHSEKLVNRDLLPHERAQWEDRIPGLPKIALTPSELSDLRLISNGGYSPIEGFMNQKDYLTVVQDMRLASGAIWSLPVTLAVNDTQAASLKTGKEVALTDTSGQPLAILELEEMYRYEKQLEAEQVYRTTDTSHPGVQNLYARADTLLGGKISMIRDFPDTSFQKYRLSPAQTRRLFQEKGWRTVVGFQTRNPIHRAHEYIQKCALEMVDALFVHPLVGETKKGDIPADVRMRCYEVLIDGYYPKDRTLLGIFPAAMRYAGPREAVFHALIRKNYGCTHFIVGRDHAGVGNFYGPFDAHKIFGEFEEGELGIKPLFFDNTFYCKRCESMASHRTCPHDPWNYVFLSGTKVREMLREGIAPPPEFTRPEVAEILIAASNNDGHQPVAPKSSTPSEKTETPS